MKKDLHPEYVECATSCVCGNKFTVLSNQTEMRVDLCNKCHPFFTGEERLVDAAGKVEKFKRKYNLS
jgi:large subunit ribosomal protein L31